MHTNRHEWEQGGTANRSASIPAPLYSQLWKAFFPIPKGLNQSAQGCEARATLGGLPKTVSTPTGLHPARRNVAATPLGLRLFFARSPRVARLSQPWAERWNPVGIQSSHTHELWVKRSIPGRTPAPPHNITNPFASFRVFRGQAQDSPSGIRVHSYPFVVDPRI
jgi:hypothetical protein